MGCKKLSYDQQGEPSPFLGVWKKDHLKESEPHFFGQLAQKRGQQKNRINYYPFGLQFNSSQRTASTPQNYLFNEGSELNRITNIYETQFRGYDPALGRFMQIDPMVNILPELSPYQYAFNNPILYNDPLGLYPEFGSGSGSSGQAICPTCPDDPKYDPYRDDPNRFFEYDSETGGVTEVPMLQEVVVEGTDQSGNDNESDAQTDLAKGLFLTSLAVEPFKDASNLYTSSNRQLIETAVKNGNTTNLTRHKSIYRTGLKVGKAIKVLGGVVIITSITADAVYGVYYASQGNTTKATQSFVGVGAGALSVALGPPGVVWYGIMLMEGSGTPASPNTSLTVPADNTRVFTPIKLVEDK